MPLWICFYKRISLFILCVGSCFIRMLIWVSISGMRFWSFGCEGMYRFMMRSDDNGLLDILKGCR